MALDNSYILPTIQSSGKFKFKSPFNKEDFEERLLTVIGIRSLEEIYKDNLDPLNFIYKKNTLTEEDYQNDINNKVPIIVFKDKGSRIYYVPANRIDGIPVSNGVEFVRTVLNINLGTIPATFNVDPCIEAIKEVVKEYLGIVGKATKVPSSASVLKTRAEYEQFMANIATTPYARSNESVTVKLKKLQESYDRMNTEYKALQKFMATTWTNNVDTVVRPTPEDIKLYTKEILIDLVSRKGTNMKAAIGEIQLFESDAFDKNPLPIYMVGMTKSIEPGYVYNGVLNKVKAKFRLEDGVMNEQNFPDIFSMYSHVEFENNDKTVGSECARASIKITLDKEINLRKFSMRLGFTDEICASRVRVVLKNKDDTMIFNTIYDKGNRFDSSTAAGLTQYLEVDDLQLNTGISQVIGKPLIPLE